MHGSGPLSRRPWPRLLAALLSGILAVFGGELVLRAALDTSSWRVWPPGLEQVFHPAPGVMAGVEGESRFLINARGFRGEAFDPGASYRILTVGGSTTECLYLDQSEAWPARLEARLDAAQAGVEVQVENAGASGRNTRDHLVQLRRLLPQHPEIDLVPLVCGVNDLALRLAQGDAYDPGAMERPGAEQRLLPRAFARIPLGEDAPGAWYRHTGWWRLASLARDRFTTATRVQDAAGAVYVTWRAHRAAAREWIDVLPDLDPALDEHRRLLDAIVGLSREAGVRLVLVTHPAVWSPTLPAEAAARLWMGGVGDYQDAPGAAYYTPRALAEGLAAFHTAQREVAAEEGLECIDLAAALGEDPAWYYDDVHLNEAGAREAARVLAEALLASAPFR